MGRFNLYTGISRERFFVKSYNKTDTDFTSNRPLHGNWGSACSFTGQNAKVC